MRGAGRIYAGIFALSLTTSTAEAAAPVDVVQGAVADTTTRDEAGKALASSSCRGSLLVELEQGRVVVDGCEAERVRLGRALTRRSGRTFGFVERRDVALAQLRLVLGRAHRCKRWPLRAQGRDVLDPRDVEAAGCRKRRYRGPIAVTVHDDAGHALTLPPVFADRDGNAVVDFAEVDAHVRLAGTTTLRDWTRIALGHDGWAGQVDLARLRAFRADWHQRWVSVGRGVPGLFVVAHPDHPGADDVRALATEARAQRQQDDYEDVRAGRMSPVEFLLRYPWSPFHRTVQRSLSPAGG